MIPHEKELVERLKNEPFALVGVNTDDSKEEYRRMAAEMGVTWRSAWDGSTEGPICRAWGVEAFPTIYVLDREGVIRYRDLRGKPLEDAVLRLLSEGKEPGAGEGGGER